jgi:hypothetical protein
MKKHAPETTMTRKNSAASRLIMFNFGFTNFIIFSKVNLLDIIWVRRGEKKWTTFDANQKMGQKISLQMILT